MIITVNVVLLCLRASLTSNSGSISCLILIISSNKARKEILYLKQWIKMVLKIQRHQKRRKPIGWKWILLKRCLNGSRNIMLRGYKEILLYISIIIMWKIWDIIFIWFNRNAQNSWKSPENSSLRYPKNSLNSLMAQNANLRIPVSQWNHYFRNIWQIMSPHLSQFRFRVY